MILRGLAGLLLGIGYGVLAGVVIVLLGPPGHDAAHPGPLIPDANEMRRFLSYLLIAVTAAGGVLVGLAVGLSSAGRAGAGAVGFGVGLLILASDGLANASWREWLVLPVGLALLGVLVSAATGRLTPHGRGAARQPHAPGRGSGGLSS